MRSPISSLPIVLLTTLLLCAITARAETIEVYALEAMPYCGSEQGRPIGLAWKFCRPPAIMEHRRFTSASTCPGSELKR